MTKRKLSSRRAQALAEQQAKERRQRIQLGGIAVVVVAVLAALMWLSNRPKTVEADLPEGADGTAWGPVDAPVIIEEWADFN